MNPLAASYMADKQRSFRVKVASEWRLQMIERAIQDADDSEASK